MKHLRSPDLKDVCKKPVFNMFPLLLEFWDLTKLMF